MSIQPKDQKILWGRAAGRCCFAECRRKLAIEAGQASPSQATVVGEMAHIVGEKATSPRGESVLPRAERDRYPNLILLCEQHHTQIDDVPDEWPIELLHQIKADHELWVESRVGGGEDAIDELYAMRINDITEKLLLHRWAEITDLGLRDQLPIVFVNGARELAIALKATPWPGRYADLEQAMQEVGARTRAYVETFTERGIERGRYVVRDRSWKAGRCLPDEEYYRHAEAEGAWQRRCTALLFNITKALNDYSDLVRRDVEPSYFLHEGRFYLLDSMGMLAGGVLEGGVIHFVDEYQEVPDDHE